MLQYILLLGTNMGDKLSNLSAAREQITLRIGKISLFSGIYVTKAWGNTNQDDFYNQVLVTESKLKPEDMLSVLLDIEKQLGRVRDTHWGPRTIDIDMLYASDTVLNTPQLTLPHPRLHERRFTLVPLADILPDFIHPVLHKSNKELLANCADTLEVSRLS